MKSISFLPALLILGETALATENYFEVRAANANTCGHYPTKISKLSHCATATPFCRSYINSVTCTRTHVTTKSVPNAATTITVTSSVTVDGDAGPTSTVTGDTTTIKTAFSSSLTTLGSGASCTAPAAKRDVEVQAAASCGIYSEADPARVTGACNLLLASSTTKTKTVKTGVAMTATDTDTTTITNAGTPKTVTVTPSATSYTTTVTAQQTACATKCAGSGAFSLEVVAAGNLLDGEFVALVPNPIAMVEPANTFSIFNFFGIPAISTFTIDPSTSHLIETGTGYIATALVTASGNSAVVFQSSSVPLGLPFLPAVDAYLKCSIANDGTLACTAGSENKFSLALSQIQIGTSVLPLEQALTLRPVCAPQ